MSCFNELEPYLSLIYRYKEENGGDFSLYYVGVTDDPERRFREHGIEHISPAPVYFETPSAEIARSIEQYCIEIFGASGGIGGGNDDSRYVYIFKEPVITAREIMNSILKNHST